MASFTKCIRVSVMSEKIRCAIDTLKGEMADVELGSYAHSWHCNLAMCFYDAAVDELGHDKAYELANNSATAFMRLLFGVETKNE